MNYIDINEGGFQSLYINLNMKDVTITVYPSITFSIYKDGSSSSVATFNPYDNGNAFLTKNGYYHTLTMNVSDAAFSDLEDETQYLIESIKDGVVLYRGKFQTTSKDLSAYSVNENKYTERVTNNNYTILD